MKNSLKYILIYVVCVLILTASFSKGFLEIDYGWIGTTILASMVFALFPILLYVAILKAKIWLPTLLCIIFLAITSYLYIRTQEDRFSTWFKEEQIRQLIVLAIMIVTTMVLGLYRKIHLKQVLATNPK
ncbi:MAG: hypothetical protein V4699_00900 [Patescibacteria group bacterium]